MMHAYIIWATNFGTVTFLEEEKSTTHTNKSSAMAMAGKINLGGPMYDNTVWRSEVIFMTRPAGGRILGIHASPSRKGRAPGSEMFCPPLPPRFMLTYLSYQIWHDNARGRREFFLAGGPYLFHIGKGRSAINYCVWIAQLLSNIRADHAVFLW